MHLQHSMYFVNVSEILGKITFQEPREKNSSFISFLVNYKRSEIYQSTQLFVGFMAIILTMMFFTIIKSGDYLNFITSSFSCLCIFILAQFMIYNYCYILGEDNFSFGILFKNKFLILANRRSKDIVSIQTDNKFSQYVIFFNHGVIKYTLGFTSNFEREEELAFIEAKKTN